MVDDTQKLTQKIKAENLSITYYYHQNIVIDIVFAFLIISLFYLLIYLFIYLLFYFSTLETQLNLTVVYPLGRN